MPRFFFHVHDSDETLDAIGTECTDADAARAEAVKASGEMLRDYGAKFWPVGEWRMWVTDETGTVVCALSFSAEEV